MPHRDFTALTTTIAVTVFTFCTLAMTASTLASPRFGPSTDLLRGQEVPGAGAGGEGGATPLSTGFEPPPVENPGFLVGALNGQAGWTVFGGTPAQPRVSNVNPALGAQHLRIIDTPTVPNTTLSGGFSPIVPAPPNTPSLTSWQISINNHTNLSDGAEYYVVGQAPSQSLTSWQVIFAFTGDILVVDDPDGPGGPMPLSRVDTGVNWTANAWQSMSVSFDPVAGNIVYAYNGVPIYTGQTIFGGTSVEQIVMFSDNFFFPNESGDFDNLVHTVIPEPHAAATAATAAIIPLLRRRRNARETI